MVRAMSESAPTATAVETPWIRAVRLLKRWQADGERLDRLLESVPGTLSRVERARVHALLVGAVRHLGRIRSHLDPLMPRDPRPIVRAAMEVAGFELLEGGPEGHAARVVHHAVEQIKHLASARESGFANAVIRRLAEALAKEQAAAADGAVPPAEWPRWYSHPEWLVQRWRDRWGDEPVRALLTWNQRPAPVVVRIRPAATDQVWPEWLHAVPGAPDFRTADPGHWPQLAEWIAGGMVTVQDAATRLAVDLLNPQPGEAVLDLCAAPGGKSLALADRMGEGTLVAVDLPGHRIGRLLENLARAPVGVRTAVVTGDLLRDADRALAERGMPDQYAAVMLDAPCSNTGVMRHRVDVKWRLQPDGIRRHALQQLDLLVAAGARVAPGGRLVYSTCSIDPEENEQVAAAFVRRSRGGFVLEETVVGLPWETGQDGAAAFRLRRTGA